MLNVLIVDDSAAIRKILQRVLRQTEIPLGKIIEAGDGCEALEILKTQQVQLILSEINMPKMDGLEFLKNLRASETGAKVPVIMVSTDGSQAKVLQAVKLGAAGYVKKPFNADQLKDKMTALF
jgi:two-component system, chemotaxis family, chemotaxis protein CheY